jgi:hypothetical protein
MRNSSAEQKRLEKPRRPHGTPMTTKTKPAVADSAPVISNPL